MDLRIEQSIFRLKVVEFALHGMVVGDIPFDRDDVDCVFMLVQDIRQDLREGLEASLKKYAARIKELRRESHGSQK